MVGITKTEQRLRALFSTLFDEAAENVEEERA